MKLDESGRGLIKSFEGLRLKPYRDEKGIWTVGWGHTDGVDERTPEITEDQAEVFFREDCEPCEQIVTKSVKVTLTQNEFNALVSFTFNAGVAAFHKSTLLQKLNAGDRQGAAKEFDRWVHVTDPETEIVSISKGLAKRRAIEKALFLADFLDLRKPNAGSQLA